MNKKTYISPTVSYIGPDIADKLEVAVPVAVAVAAAVAGSVAGAIASSVARKLIQ